MILLHPVHYIVDKVLPYSAEELRCGQRKQPKTQMRLQLIELLNDIKNGRGVDFGDMDAMRVKKIMTFIEK